MTSILKPEKAFLIQVVEQSNPRFKYYTLPGKAPRGIEYGNFNLEGNGT